MTTFGKSISVFTALVITGAAYLALPVLAGPNSAGAFGSARVLKEGKGAAFVVGTKQAVAVYRNDGGACKVSVAVSDTYPEQIPYALASVRFTSRVEGGSAAEVETSDGAKLALSCAVGAKSLMVEVGEQIALAVPRVMN